MTCCLCLRDSLGVLPQDGLRTYRLISSFVLSHCLDFPPSSLSLVDVGISEASGRLVNSMEAAASLEMAEVGMLCGLQIPLLTLRRGNCPGIWMD